MSVPHSNRQTQSRYDWPTCPAEAWPNTPRIDWPTYLALWAEEVRQDRSPAAQFLADYLEEARAEAQLHGLTTPSDHQRWNAETTAEAHALMASAWDDEDRWEDGPDAHGWDGHHADEQTPCECEGDRDHERN